MMTKNKLRNYKDSYLKFICYKLFPSISSVLFLIDGGDISAEAINVQGKRRCTWIQSGNPWCGRWYWATSGNAYEDESSHFSSSSLRCCQHPWCHGRSEPHEHQCCGKSSILTRKVTFSLVYCFLECALEGYRSSGGSVKYFSLYLAKKGSWFCVPVPEEKICLFM